MIVDNDGFYLDLPFYSRPLHRLTAEELKLCKFGPVYKGQMDLYSKWLDRCERRNDEEAPLRLILCTETSREQVALLEMHKDGMVVAEYWTAQPPKEKLRQRIAKIRRAAQQCAARGALGPCRDHEDKE